jgi:hypothetical protein
MSTYNAHYQTLQVRPDADPVVIEAAYKALMKKHHPDMHPAGPTAGERIAADLNRAWHTLRDPDRRARYDADEKSREERRKVELARAFPDPAPGAAEPARRAPPAPAQKGQRIAAWVGAAGLAFLVGAVVILARGPEQLDGGVSTGSAPVVASVAGAPMLGLPAGIDEEAFRVLPVNRQQVFTAVAEFKRVAGVGGLPAAARVSQRCFDMQARSRGIGEFDYCVAFDHAASRRDLMPEKPSDPHFASPTLIERHVRAAADSLSKDTTIIEGRLFEIRRLADSALLDLFEPRPVQLSEAQPVSVPAPVAARPAVQPLARRAPPRPRSAPPRAERPRQEQPQDFLERQGGIY